MQLHSSILILAFASMALACAPASSGKTLPDAGYDHSAPTLPDDPGDDSNPGDAPAPVDKTAPATPTAPSTTTTSRWTDPSLTANQQAQLLAKYDYIDPTQSVRTAVLAKALIYFDTNKSKIKNVNYITVVDFSLPSNKPRMQIIDMKTGSVWSIRVAHGKGSDTNNDAYADKFSNTPGSDMSSLGVYTTGETYSGTHGYSLRLDGLSSTNSNARSRAIVVHGADYVVDANQKEGRSWGCLAVSMTNRTKVVDMLKNGSMIYASN